MNTEMERIFVVLWMTFGLYIMVLVMILTDLWSGVRKAKKKNIIRSSYGFRRTVDKVARYYNTLIALSVIDAMQMAGVWYLDKYYGYNIPLIPIITMLGAIGIGLIELKSIFEKAEDKVQYERLGHLAGKIIANKEDLGEVAKVIVDYMDDKTNSVGCKYEVMNDSKCGSIKQKE